MIEIYCAAYVADMIFALLAVWHGLCAGLCGGCMLCLENLGRAQAYENLIDMVMEDLHLNCSSKKGVPGQQDAFRGSSSTSFWDACYSWRRSWRSS